jgi:hypothetical protein
MPAVAVLKKCVTTGASYVTEPSRVPVSEYEMAELVTALPAPAAAMHITELALIHEAVKHEVEPNRSVCVGSALPRFIPKIVTTPWPVTGLFPLVRVTTGASYVNTDCKVPT